MIFKSLSLILVFGLLNFYPVNSQENSIETKYDTTTPRAGILSTISELITAARPVIQDLVANFRFPKPNYAKWVRVAPRIYCTSAKCIVYQGEFWLNKDKHRQVTTTTESSATEPELIPASS